MKTETQIAESLIHLFKLEERKHSIPHHYTDKGRCIEHKATCQRFLEFLEKTPFGFQKYLCKKCKVAKKELNEKITDLKQAIKLYNEAGI